MFNSVQRASARFFKLLITQRYAYAEIFWALVGFQMDIVWLSLSENSNDFWCCFEKWCQYSNIKLHWFPFPSSRLDRAPPKISNTTKKTHKVHTKAWYRGAICLWSNLKTYSWQHPGSKRTSHIFWLIRALSTFLNYYFRQQESSCHSIPESWLSVQLVTL